MNGKLKLKKDGIFISLSPDMIEDLKRTARIRGMDLSEFLGTLLNEAIDEEKENHPQVFERDIEIESTHLVYADGAGTVNEKEFFPQS